MSHLNQNPTQFQIELSVVGQQVTSFGGTGLAISATGGAQGSNVVGQIVEAGGNHFRITQKAATEAMSEKMQDLVARLTAVRSQLQSQAPDKTIVRGILDSLQNTWVPTLITNVLSTVLTASLGI